MVSMAGSALCVQWLGGRRVVDGVGVWCFDGIDVFFQCWYDEDAMATVSCYVAACQSR